MDEITEIRLDPETVLKSCSYLLNEWPLSTVSDVATTTPAVPYKSQKGFTKLLYQHHTYTKTHTMKYSSTWECTNRKYVNQISELEMTYEMTEQ